MREWVSLQDSLPSNGGKYLVYGPHHVELAVWNEHYKVWDDDSGDDYWHDANGWFTHWMILPEPPNA